MTSAAQGHIGTIRRSLQTARLVSVGPFPGEYQLGPDNEALVALDKVHDALAGIANADTHYPSMPSGFTGDWEVLRDEARAVLTEDEDGVWE